MPRPVKSKLSKLLKDAREAGWQREPELLMASNIPKPLHGVNPRSVLGAAWWENERRAAYRSTYFHCKACGIFKHDTPERQLDAHEVYSVDNLCGRAYYERAVPLCKLCHNYIHSGRLNALLAEGKITQARFIKVIQHGDAVLQAVGLVRPPESEGPFADWGDWRLVVYGMEFPPKFKTEAEWIRAYST
jgi:hypothetical protein